MSRYKRFHAESALAAPKPAYWPHPANPHRVAVGGWSGLSPRAGRPLRGTLHHETHHRIASSQPTPG